MRGDGDGIFSAGGRSVRLAAFCAVAAGALSVSAWSLEKTVTLSEALRLAAESSAQVEVADASREAARRGREAARSLYRPSVDLNGGRVMLNEDPFFVFGPSAFPAGEQDFWKYRVSMTGILWDGGRRAAGVSAAESFESAAGARGVGAALRAQGEALDSFLGALVHREQGIVLDQRAKALEEHRRIAQALYEQGVVARNDLLRTEVALRSVKDQREGTYDGEALACASLGRALGFPAGQSAKPSGPLSQPPELTMDLPELLARATARNPELQALREALNARQSRAEALRKEGYPVALAEGFYQYEQNRYLLYPHQYGLFIGVKWNLFDGGQRRAQVAEAQAELRRAEAELREAERLLALGIERSYREYRQALREAGSAGENEGAALENLRIVSDQYGEGLVRTLEVLDAESLLAESRFQLISLKYRAFAKQAALLVAAGEDLVKFYGEPPAAETEER